LGFGGRGTLRADGLTMDLETNNRKLVLDFHSLSTSFSLNNTGDGMSYFIISQRKYCSIIQKIFLVFFNFFTTFCMVLVFKGLLKPYINNVFYNIFQWNKLIFFFIILACIEGMYLEVSPQFGLLNPGNYDSVVLSFKASASNIDNLLKHNKQVEIRVSQMFITYGDQPTRLRLIR
jgi:hypothetical protein